MWDSRQELERDMGLSSKFMYILIILLCCSTSQLLFRWRLVPENSSQHTDELIYPAPAGAHWGNCFLMFLQGNVDVSIVLHLSNWMRFALRKYGCVKTIALLNDLCNIQYIGNGHLPEEAKKVYAVIWSACTVQWYMRTIQQLSFSLTKHGCFVFISTFSYHFPHFWHPPPLSSIIIAPHIFSLLRVL